MNRAKVVSVFVTVFALSYWSNLDAATDEAALARQAEQAGNLRKALTHYIATLQTVPEASPEDQSLREKIIKIARKLDPRPAIPEEAHRHATRATAFLKDASSDQDFTPAFAEFKKALRLAPWWADVYYNFGLAQESAGNPESAIRSFKLFLLAAPNDRVAKDIRTKIYTLEVQAEKLVEIKRWVGRWKSEGKSIQELRVKGNNIRMVQIKPSRKARKAGWKAGDTVFYGTARGLTVKGKKINVSSHPKIIRCFGRAEILNMSGELSPDVNTITIRYKNSNFKISTCKINYYFDDVDKYTRIQK